MTITVDREPTARAVSLGAWGAELLGDEFAMVNYRGVDVLRAIRFVVRDRDWRTVPARVHSFEITVDRVVLDLDFDAWGVRMSAQLTATAKGDSLRVEVDAVAHSDFLKNRVGLVVLHHFDDAGAAARVSGDRVREAEFPTAISPHQPFGAFRRFEWRRPGAEVTLDFEGAIFEMEDQRNWTDASFKTYSTPLSEPYPTAVTIGERVRQAVTVSVVGSPVEPSPGGGPLVLEPTTAGTVMPLIGTVLEAGTDAGALSGWPLGFIQAEVALGGAEAASEVDASAAAARDLGIGLDLRITADSEAVGLDALVGRVPDGVLARLGVFDVETHLAEESLRGAARDALRERADEVTLVVGTRAHFAELNRTVDRLPVAGQPVTFSFTPTMHSYEIAHVRDSLAVQGAIARQAAGFAGDGELHVGPITLEARFNAVAVSDASPAIDGARDETAIDDTDLYGHPIVPGWVFATLVQLAGPTTGSVSVFRASGHRGLVDGGVATAAGRMVRRMSELSGSDIRSRYLDADLAAAVVGDRLFVANLTGRSLTREIAMGSVVREISLSPYGFDDWPVE